MCSTQNWPRGVIIALTIVSCGVTLRQEVGSECTNENGVKGLCQLRDDCDKDADLGVTCNSRKNIICCSGNNHNNGGHHNSSDNQNKKEQLESRFGFSADFFNAPIIHSQINLPNLNYFQPQEQQFPNNNVLGTKKIEHFLEERPYQNLDQGVVTKPTKKKYTTSFYGQNIDSSNVEQTYNYERTTKTPQNNNYNYYESQNPFQNINQQNQNKYPIVSSHRPNQNHNSNNNNLYYNNNNYETTNPSDQQNNNYYNNHPTVNGKPHHNQNTYNYPSSESYQSNKNNFNYPSTTSSQRPNQNQMYNNRPNSFPYESNQNNNYNHNYETQRPNSNIYANTPSPSNGFNSQNSNNRPTWSSQSSRPINNNNNQHSTSSIYFPDNSDNEQNYYTQETTTTKRYNNGNYNNPTRPNANNKRISETKCEEYSKSLTTTISALPLSIDSSPRPISVEKCDSKGVGLIVGGTKAELGEFPHMAAIGFRAASGNPWNCGGTLISERYVMTAAHCTHSALGNPVRVRLGDLNLHKSDDRAKPVDYTIEEIIVHPQYLKTSKYNDIALLRLNKNVQFNKNIRPACLYNKNMINAYKVTATGWGSTDFGSASSDHLLKVDLDLIENQRCNKLYEAESKTNTLNKGILDTMVCAGDLAGGHDTCLGDSGGPLVIRSEKNMCIFNVVGITSFGKSCATENSPGVYTRVSSYLSWIEQIVWL